MRGTTVIRRLASTRKARIAAVAIQEITVMRVIVKSIPKIENSASAGG